MIALIALCRKLVELCRKSVIHTQPIDILPLADYSRETIISQIDPVSEASLLPICCDRFLKKREEKVFDCFFNRIS